MFSAKKNLRRLVFDQSYPVHLISEFRGVPWACDGAAAAAVVGVV